MSKESEQFGFPIKILEDQLKREYREMKRWENDGRYQAPIHMNGYLSRITVLENAIEKLKNE